MYHSSTQKKYWTFKNEGEIAAARETVNARYKENYAEKHGGEAQFLSKEEERLLLRWYDERLLKEFCRHFNPPILMNCIGTASQYVKRLYLRHSVMVYNPKLMILAAVWLACKTEEFNISMEQFKWNVANLAHLLPVEKENFGNEFAEKFERAVLDIELILIKELNFHLTVHNPFRPFEGFLIDVKTRFKDPGLADPEILREPAMGYLYSSLFTDVVLLFTPSQIALASILSAASKHNIVMDTYVTKQLLQGQPQKVLDETIKNIKKIRSMIRKNPKPPSSEVARQLEQKLERCRDKELDPLTEEYSRKRGEEEERRDKEATQRWRQEAQRQKQFETDLLGF